MLTLAPRSSTAVGAGGEGGVGTVSRGGGGGTEASDDDGDKGRVNTRRGVKEAKKQVPKTGAISRYSCTSQQLRRNGSGSGGGEKVSCTGTLQRLFYRSHLSQAQVFNAHGSGARPSLRRRRRWGGQHWKAHPLWVVPGDYSDHHACLPRPQCGHNTRPQRGDLLAAPREKHKPNHNRLTLRIVG